MVSRVWKIRSSASIWVQVDGPGDWFIAEIKKSLQGLRLPFAVTRADAEVSYLDFSRPLTLLYSRSQSAPILRDANQPVSSADLRCLQALGRMETGAEDEIAALTGVSIDVTKDLLAGLEKKKLVMYRAGIRTHAKSKPAQLDLFPLWRCTSPGLSLALRSWSIPKGIQFTSRLEAHRRQIGNEHRRIARLWPAWLNTAWPQAEIWAGWSEVRLPATFVIPDGLAWGRMHGYETLFWLEVGDQHKSRCKITEITFKRLNQARELRNRTGVRLVYVHLSTSWVHEAAKEAYAELPDDMAIVLGNWNRFGELPILEWGRITSGT